MKLDCLVFMCLELLLKELWSTYKVCCALYVCVCVFLQVLYFKSAVIPSLVTSGLCKTFSTV